jgi:hypothetical protein
MSIFSVNTQEIEDGLSKLLRLDPPDGNLVWRYRTTPIFPVQWPPTQRSSLVRYIYLTGQDFEKPVMDGELKASPWAKLVYETPRALPLFRNLTKNIREKGIQGVRPLMEQEIAILSTLAHTENILFKLWTKHKTPILPEQEDAALLKAFYSLWYRCHGVIGSEIIQNHEPFFFWFGANE